MILYVFFFRVTLFPKPTLGAFATTSSYKVYHTILFSFPSVMHVNFFSIVLIFFGTGGYNLYMLHLTLPQYAVARLLVQALISLFLSSLQSVPAPHNPEFTTYDHVTCNGQITFETMKPRSMEEGNMTIIRQ
jgi:hypothetical protein